MPKEGWKSPRANFNKLKMMSPMSAEAPWCAVISTGWWRCRGPSAARSHDLETRVRMLDEDHYGLEEVKERIVEYLAVQRRVKKLKGPILCLVGPPGVGKTSLGQSDRRATGASSSG